jgi:DNA-binding NarL/FixJ family response regulator
MTPTTTATRVLLADRPGFGRDALASLLRSIAGLELVAVAGDADELRAALAARRPEVLVVDDRLAGALEPLAPLPRVIVVGADDDPGFAARAARLAAETWLEKDRAAQLLPALLAAPEPLSATFPPRLLRGAGLGIGH